MKTILALFSFLYSLASQGQYYYNDIIGTLETNRQMKAYLVNKVRTVSVTGTDQRGAKTAEFSEFQEVKENGTVLKTSSFNNLNKTVIYSKFDNQGRLIRTTDSSTAVESSTTYEYDARDRITRVQNTTKDPANDFSQAENHLWIYNAAGQPERMWRILNNTDSIEIRFTPDEQGNPGDERVFKKGVETTQYYSYFDEDKKLKFAQTGVIYYYYDDQNRLSDVVRFNLKANRLLPDFMFEYDEKNRVIQKITTTANLKLGYLIWRYIFDEKGLKTKEALFNNEKQLTGKIEYSYTFGQ
ncbi:MAG: RHS repeat domain-containing protein [Bacteroidota bacterium]|nr:RHS repeat domain-containing protein [Bacteroidota bacterium]